MLLKASILPIITRGHTTSSLNLFFWRSVTTTTQK